MSKKLAKETNEEAEKKEIWAARAARKVFRFKQVFIKVLIVYASEKGKIIQKTDKSSALLP